jgi:hypothetical protein
VTRIVFASPAEPSGASWLINCFLELGVKVAHKPVTDAAWRQSATPPDSIWQPDGHGRHRLHPRAAVLKKFLPALTRVDTFQFRDDVEVEYVQDLPDSAPAADHVLCFVRDPRDSMYSAFRRMPPAMDYHRFLQFPDPDTLLDRPSQWQLWVERWQALPDARWFTFEAYKQDANALLRRIVDRLEIASGDEAIARAVAESTFDKARQAEAQYRPRVGDDTGLVNRSGRVGDWADHPDGRAGAVTIEAKAGAALRALGYACGTQPDGGAEHYPGPSLPELSAFAADIAEEDLRGTNLPNHRIHRLLENLQRVAQANGWESAGRLEALRQRFVEGSAHHFAQMRDLLKQQRQRT